MLPRPPRASTRHTVQDTGVRSEVAAPTRRATICHHAPDSIHCASTCSTTYERSRQRMRCGTPSAAVTVIAPGGRFVTSQSPPCRQTVAPHPETRLQCRGCALGLSGGVTQGPLTVIRTFVRMSPSEPRAALLCQLNSDRESQSGLRFSPAISSIFGTEPKPVGDQSRPAPRIAVRNACNCGVCGSSMMASAEPSSSRTPLCRKPT